METITDLRLVAIVGDFSSNIEVSVDTTKKALELRIGKKFLFGTLTHRKEIVGFLNKKLDELVEEHIGTLAKKEEERNSDL